MAVEPWGRSGCELVPRYDAFAQIAYAVTVTVGPLNPLRITAAAWNWFAATGNERNITTWLRMAVVLVSILPPPPTTTLVPGHVAVASTSVSSVLLELLVTATFTI